MRPAGGTQRWPGGTGRRPRDVYEHPANRFVADFVGTSNVLDGAQAQDLLGRTGAFAVRPEHILVLSDGKSPPPGTRSVDATVAEVVYAGPTTRITARTPAGVELTATMLSAEASRDLEHGAAVMLAWPDSAVTDLNTKPEE